MNASTAYRDRLQTVPGCIRLSRRAARAPSFWIVTGPVMSCAPLFVRLYQQRAPGETSRLWPTRDCTEAHLDSAASRCTWRRDRRSISAPPSLSHQSRACWSSQPGGSSVSRQKYVAAATLRTVERSARAPAGHRTAGRLSACARIPRNTDLYAAGEHRPAGDG